MMLGDGPSDAPLPARIDVDVYGNVLTPTYWYGQGGDSDIFLPHYEGYIPLESVRPGAWAPAYDVHDPATVTVWVLAETMVSEMVPTVSYGAPVASFGNQIQSTGVSVMEDYSPATIRQAMLEQGWIRPDGNITSEAAALEIYKAALYYGVTGLEIDTAAGWTPGTADGFVLAQGWPRLTGTPRPEIPGLSPLAPVQTVQPSQPVQTVPTPSPSTVQPVPITSQPGANLPPAMIEPDSGFDFSKLVLPAIAALMLFK